MSEGESESDKTPSRRIGDRREGHQIGQTHRSAPTDIKLMKNMK